MVNPGHTQIHVRSYYVAFDAPSELCPVCTLQSAIAAGISAWEDPVGCVANGCEAAYWYTLMLPWDATRVGVTLRLGEPEADHTAAAAAASTTTAVAVTVMVLLYCCCPFFKLQRSTAHGFQMEGPMY